MALVYADPSQPDAMLEPSLVSMRCSWCKHLKPCCACKPGMCKHAETSAFPPSCARWRRGVCKDCRSSRARSAPVIKRKLESARHRYGSVKSVTLDYVERLLRVCSNADKLTDEEVAAKWRLVKKDASQPFSRDNMTWVKREG